ncbi:glycosyltransferase family 76 protein [Cucurbitaria berberidis CBS 394.84]|uniref:GPI mannosyltransferase 2 n=1 Tax=Cucurbitaria berberidis CBS 394.84 TaxID=1168544 RepID=A0A9P4L8L3_9PLEO|nr:glycosyltransferase family 76 protein [Cucurbitaria berberidis CBS 394.84]KAF1845452.1 glycosyltransferase family 76 protein [Cucurbitaria berberidis CBS 394.84]
MLEAKRVRQLALIFCSWKALLLLLAAFCPGPGYDTSALVLFNPSTHRHDNLDDLSRQDRLTINLFRWDAFYFVKSAERGHTFEQDWAFSWAYSQLLKLTAQLCCGSVACPLQYYIITGIVLSNVFHFISVLVLYRLLTMILDPQQQHHVAFNASVLHILTPASLFYSAPYAEALFSLLNLTGMLYYAQSKATAKAGGSPFQEDAYKLSSGLVFASASLMRSNGLLSGLIFLYDVARYMPRIASAKLSVRDFRRIFVTCVAGLFVAIGFAWPQYLAYTEFCGREASLNSRPWCEKSVPSIYSWVQSHYWNVGFFRYWTLSNFPLFLLAAPMLWLLLESSVTVLRSCIQRPLHGHHASQTHGTVGPKSASSVAHSLPELALPQLVLAVMAFTSFHVQIINRIASAYPTWYVMIATWLGDSKTTRGSGEFSRRDQWFVRGMVIYALTQGMLFANFLPPA